MKDVISDSLNTKKNKFFFARIADSLLEKGQIEDAVKICEEGLRDYPAYSQAHFVLGKCYLQKGMADQARKEFERVLIYESNHLSAIKYLSDLYKELKLADVHKELLFKLHTLDPVNEQVFEDLNQTGHYDKWLQQFEELYKEEISESVSTEPDIIEQEPQKTVTRSNDQFETDIEHNDFDIPVEYQKEEKSDNLEEFNTILEGIFNEAQKRDMEDYDEESFKIESDDIVNQVLTSQDHKNKFSDSDQEVDMQIEDIDVKIDDRYDLEENEPPKTDSDSKKEIVPEEASVNREKIEIEVIHRTEQPEQAEPEEDEEQAVFNGKIVSRTLGEILISQKKYHEAKKVFELLKKQQGENPYLDKKIDIIDQLIALSKE